MCPNDNWKSHGVLASPFPSVCVMFIPISFIKVCDLRHEGIIWVGVGQQRTEREQNFGDRKCGRPLVLEDVEADASVWINVAVVDSGRKCTLGWFKWVVSWEANVDEEDTACIWGVIWAHDGRLPCELVFLIEGTSRAVGGRVLAKVDEFFLNSFECHCFP